MEYFQDTAVNKFRKPSIFRYKLSSLLMANAEKWGAI